VRTPLNLMSYILVKRLFSILATIPVYTLCGCTVHTQHFRWADDPIALTKAALKENEIQIVRNCGVYNVSPSSPLVKDGVLTLSNSGRDDWACFITYDRRFIAVGPLNTDQTVNINLDQSTPWYAYRNRLGESVIAGFWLRSSSVPQHESGFFVVFKTNAKDGEATANITVFKHLSGALQMAPQPNPPVRVQFVTSTGYATFRMTLP
jgi:hypothetical protein